MIEIYIITVLLIIAIILYFVKKYTKIDFFKGDDSSPINKAEKLYNITHDKFKNNTLSYIDYIKCVNRDPILYFELKQLYKGGKNVTVDDYKRIIKKYMTV